MAMITITKNVLENSKDILEITEEKSVRDIIDSSVLSNPYEATYCECYDVETGETTYEPIGTDLSVLIIVNGKSAELDYVIKRQDSVEIIILPQSKDAAGYFVSGLSGAVVGALQGGVCGGGYGAIVGAIIGFVVGVVAYSYIDRNMNKKDSSHSNGIDTTNLPDIRGASNQLLLNNPIPAVLGKHIVTPFIVGSPYNVITGVYGHTNYIKTLYLVGYGPMKITDIRLGERLLARNQRWFRNENIETVYHGSLRGVNSEGGIDAGDIVSVWDENDITVEILQQGQNGEPIDYGTVYPYARIQDDINANVLYIVDGHNDNPVAYKGVSLKNGLRNNCIKFTRQFPISATVELNFANGLYKTYSESDSDGNSTVKYESIPLWTALQWRVYSKDNDESNGDVSGIIEGETNPNSEDYWWDSVNKTEKTSVRGWHSFESVNDSNGLSFGVNITLTGTASNTYTQLHAGLIKYGTSFDGKLNIQITLSKPASSDMKIEGRIYLYNTANFNYTVYHGRDDDKPIDHTVNIKAEKYIDIEAIFPLGETSVTIIESYSSSNNRNIYKESVSVSGGEIKATLDSLKINDVLYFQGKTIVSQKVKDFASITENKKLSIVNYKTLDVYDASARSNDVAAHTGNEIDASLINNNWIGAKVFNFQPFCGSWDAQEGLSEFRIITNVDFEQWARNNFTYTDEEDFIKQFKAYFMSSSNTMKSIEIRCVRLSPNYIDETSSTSKKSAATYNDIFTWKTLSTDIFDSDKLEKDNVLERKRPLSEDLMRKCCLIAVSAKTDNTDNISNTLKKLSCMAESFAPYYDDDLKQWFPKNVSSSMKYFKPNNPDGTKGDEITEEQFIQDRQNGLKSTQRKNGNDFTKNLVTNVIRGSDNIDANGRYVIPNDMEDTYIEDEDGNKLYNKNIARYCENNAASIVLLAGLGQHVGYDALSYDDYDMVSLIDMYNFCKDVTDGSTYSEDGWHYDENGDEVKHSAGEIVHMKFSANAYLYENKKLEEIIALISIAGRSAYTRSKNNKLKFVVDKEEPYPVALINQANTLSSSYSISYEEPPSGLMIPFKDENDGYQTNNLYAMMDGETEKDHTGPIESYSLNFVTNPYQAWSLGRYILANRILGKEKVVKKIGMEGYSIPFGSVIKLQDDTMLLGTDYGARITKLIEDDNYIYGFLTDRTYHYDGTLDEDDKVKLGVVIMQPGQFKESRVITLRLAPAGTKVNLDGKIFTVKNGETNVVLFETKLAKGENVVDAEECVVYKYNPQIDNVVGFGQIGNECALYRVAGVKSDTKHNFELTLIKYQPEMFNYGKKLPTFQSNMTPRNFYSESYNLSSSASTSDVVNALNQAANIAAKIVASDTNPNISSPDIITGFSAVAGETGIRFLWNSLSSKGLKNTLGCYFIQVSKNNGSTWNDFAETESNSYTYTFNRSIDGYPEYSELNNWKFRIKARNAYKKESEEWTEAVLNTDTYGTWIVSKPEVSIDKSADRRIILSMLQPASSSSRAVYGNVKYRIRIKRGLLTYNDGSKTIIVDADESWFKPSVSGNPYGDENNYKDGVGYVVSSGTYVQVVPLYGQGDDGKRSNMCDTPYLFDIQAFNEAKESEWLSESGEEIAVTATVSSLRDIVYANAEYAKIYVPELSAITANLGEISQGSLSGSNDNFWVLSTKDAPESWKDYKGAFSVGDDNQYFRVIPVIDGTGNVVSYKIELKAANIEFSTDSHGNNETNIEGGTYVYNSDKTKRLAISHHGIKIQKKVSDEWTNIGQVYCDTSSNMIITNELDESHFPHFVTIVGDSDLKAYHFENTVLDNEGGNALSGSFSGTFKNISDLPVQGNYALSNEANTVASIPLDTVQNAGYKKISVFTKAEYVAVEKDYIHLTDSTKDVTVTVVVDDLNSQASTSWGLTSEQVSSKLFKRG